jgi:D-psicose/D-tagatose/L-ribulose 3-epimerase
MKLAVSNIAWTREEEVAAAKVMQEQGLSYVEIAPTKAWDRPLEAADDDIAAYRAWWTSRNFEVIALQSLNFGQAHFQIFRDAALRDEMLAYLKGITVLGAKLGAKVMVFGSPKNRLVGHLPQDDAMSIAISFFGELGRIAADNNVFFCIEPNPVDYGCDFITDSRSGIELVKAVNHPGFGLHLDAAGLTLAGDNPSAVIPEALPYMKHFHISEPFLEEVQSGTVDHATIAKTLAEVGYHHSLSIEMKPGTPGSNLQRLERSLRYVKQSYSM